MCNYILCFKIRTYLYVYLNVIKKKAKPKKKPKCILYLYKIAKDKKVYGV